MSIAAGAASPDRPSAVTTHVLDTAAGRPADGVSVVLAVLEPDGWRDLGTGVTDADGRVGALGPATAAPGTYRLTFATGAYFAAEGRAAFFPEIAVTFTVADAEHYHVPILLSPFAFSTYRGS